MKADSARRKPDIFLDAIFPKQCVCCNALVDSDEELCDNCIRNIERVDLLKRCKKCGLEKEHCDCNRYAYHFTECIAPFYNVGLARRGLYDFKFKRRRSYGIFFAREMAKTVVSEFYGIKFDGIVYVPLSFTGYLVRGFNQSRVLAEYLSDLTDIPLLENILKKKITFGHQRGKKLKQRFKSVRKLFNFNSTFKQLIANKDILLVDDIKTSGATLDECARQLLFGGAKSVYCVTALITDKEYGKIKSKKQHINTKKLLSRFGNKSG